ncbi:MAG: leucyl/phenylalanyl-tRNA--protein transferase [Deltaproteobacteria bacterium]|nr:leucyl/phenylalanyl-tRNA--protein transferase [Deltaproteobacteria bacterium]
MPIFRLPEKNSFPPPHFAAPNGLLAVGGDLSEKRLIAAYRKGIFPWYSKGDPVLWWSPDPRMVLYPQAFRISRSLRRTISREVFTVTSDTAFKQVICACARVRQNCDEETWITDEMIDAYCRLFSSGYAHSIEAWKDGDLVGGLYGVAIGGVFFGESMFTRVANASKVALAALCNYLSGLSFDMIDCQVATAHLRSLGAVEIPRKRFLEKLLISIQRPTIRGDWDIAACNRHRGLSASQVQVF